MQLTITRATEADAEALVQVQIAAFHHDSVLYPEVEPGGPPGYDSVSFTTDLLDQVGVAVTPGIGYGRSGEGYVRFSLTIPDALLVKGLSRLSGWRNTRHRHSGDARKGRSSRRERVHRRRRHWIQDIDVPAIKERACQPKCGF